MKRVRDGVLAAFGLAVSACTQTVFVPGQMTAVPAPVSDPLAGYQIRADRLGDCTAELPGTPRRIDIAMRTYGGTAIIAGDVRFSGRVPGITIVVRRNGNVFPPVPQGLAAELAYTAAVARDLCGQVTGRPLLSVPAPVPRPMPGRVPGMP